MSADDQQHFHPDPSSPDLDLQYTPGNRPASGARRATPGEVLSQGFQGAQNAGDFLGLDTEFTASFDPSQAPPSESLDLSGPPTIPDGFESSGEVGDPTAQPYESATETASAFEYGQDLGEEHEDYGDGFAVQSAPASSKRPVFLALGVALAGFGAVFFGSDIVSRFRGSSDPEVAQRTPSPSKVENSPSVLLSEESSSSVSTEPQGAVETTPFTDPLSEVAQVPSELVPEVTPTETTSPRPRSSRKTPTSEASQETASSSESPTGALAGLLPTPGPTPRTFPALTGAEYQWASEDLLELIWRGDSIPMEAIRAPAKTLMPRVGDVRVFTTTGDLFDGRLYAVGQNRVWIDTEPGRVGLDGDHVERIEVLTASAPRGGSERAVPGRRVRVRVPGGMLFGNVLKAEGDEVMLLLEDGGKVRVKSEDIEELGSGRAIVVGR